MKKLMAIMIMLGSVGVFAKWGDFNDYFEVLSGKGYNIEAKADANMRSEEHTSELQSPIRN